MKQDSLPHNPVDHDNSDNPASLARANPIINAESAGPDSQYSHGLSVYLPWARPTADRTIMKEYEQYQFNETKWFSFLDQYWGPGKDLACSTMRDSCKSEDQASAKKNSNGKSMEASEGEGESDKLNEDIVSLMFNSEGPLNRGGTLSGDKPNPRGTTGDGCTCGSIKNYLRDTRTRRERGKSADKKPAFPGKQTIFGD